MNDLTTFEQIRIEYEQVGIGPRIFAELKRLARNCVRHYDSRVYAGFASWDDAREDLIQDFVLQVLIGERQLEYVMLHAGDIKHFRSLMVRQLKRLLARRRRRTVIDNLLGRCKEIASRSPFRLVDSGSRWSYTQAGRDVRPGALSSDSIRELALQVSMLPVVPSRAVERAPMVYSAESLSTILQRIVASHDAAISVSDLDQIFSLALPGWIPSFLPIEGIPGVDDTHLTPEDELNVKERAIAILGRCDGRQKEMLRLKLIRGLSDSEICREMRISRPTAAKRRREVFDLISEHLRLVPVRLHEPILNGISSILFREAV